LLAHDAPVADDEARRGLKLPQVPKETIVFLVFFIFSTIRVQKFIGWVVGLLVIESQKDLLVLFSDLLQLLLAQFEHRVESAFAAVVVVLLPVSYLCMYGAVPRLTLGSPVIEVSAVEHFCRFSV
jgi:hypothetical protein